MDNLRWNMEVTLLSKLSVREFVNKIACMVAYKTTNQTEKQYKYQCDSFVVNVFDKSISINSITFKV